MLYNFIVQCDYTPSELREASILACILYEERKEYDHLMPIPNHINDALETIYKWTDRGN